MAEMSGGDVVAEMLSAYGVDVVFGMAGFQHLPLYDAIKRRSPRLQHVVIHDEKHGAFMADGYARVGYRLGVCDATVGPGATNLISGVAESFHASVPILALTSDINAGIALRAATQECEQMELFRPLTKWSVRIERLDRVPELLGRAMRLAMSGRPAAVHVDILEDVFHGRMSFPETVFAPRSEYARYPALPSRPDADAVERAAQLLADAQRPVVIAGGGVVGARAWDELTALAELAELPVATTMSGKGSLSEVHPLSLGVCGRFSKGANDWLARADVILVVGCKLGEIATRRWQTIPAQARLIHADADPAVIERVYSTEVGLVGDARLTLRDLVAALRDRSPRGNRPDPRPALAATRARWEREVEARVTSDERPINVARLLHELRRALPPDSIVVADGGFASHWSGLFFDVTAPGRRYVANRGQAAIGYGLSGAIGAQLAAPDSIVCALVGDGGLGMSVVELETAARLNLPILVVLIDNQSLGYVKALQHALYEGRYQSADFLDIDYGRVAEELGCYGRRVEDPQALSIELQRALAAGRPAVLDIRVTTDPGQMLPQPDARTGPRAAQVGA